MCWGIEATVAMAGIGAGGAALAVRLGRPAAVPVALGYFAAMEALQAAGYLAIDRCGTPLNETVTFLSMLHIAFQPVVVNAFAMALIGGVAPRTRVLVHLACAGAAVLMLLQLYPFAWAGACTPGTVLCGPALCTVSGSWHLAWEVPFNDILAPVRDALAPFYLPFPGYVVTVFLLPVLYGAWRFTLFHLLVGPVAARLLTDNPAEFPAIWCLFSIGILLIGLHPAFWRHERARRPAPLG